MAKRRKPRALDSAHGSKTTDEGDAADLTPPGEPFRFLTFTDLHVSAKTLTRALRVIDLVGQLATEHRADILCLGDFWDQRNVLSVRQVDAVLDALEAWKMHRAYLIPGNHDQVTIDGRVHGIRIFDAFPNITVVTEPIHDDERKLAFVPWREDPAEQARVMHEAMGDAAMRTVFAHAEAPGAIANSGRAMDGRFALDPRSGKFVPRAVYLGHFHKRQKLGDRCWYIGSPFEMNVGERDEPHGVALITNEQIEPQWIDFDEFPKHYVFTFPVSAKDAARVREQDIVEVRATAEEIDSLKMHKTLKKFAATDVRTNTLKSKKESGAPHFALSLADSVDAFVTQETEKSETIDASEVDELTALGKAILAEVPDARTIVPLGSHVDVQAATVSNFCAIKGSVSFGLHKRGLVLLRGRMGIGKTSLMDALTWCFYGVTTPRKAGASGASLRADDVIHDDADRCSVTVTIEVDGKHEITITREKTRGSGAKLHIDGIDPPAGISDQQDLVNHVLGFNAALWRSAVYLGQGAVANFVTDGDKRRKELLANAFNLGACADALRFTRAKLKGLVGDEIDLKSEIASNARALDVLTETDFKEQIAKWEEQRIAAKEGAQKEGEAAKGVIANAEEHLKTEPQWIAAKEKYSEGFDKLTKSLSALTDGGAQGKLQQQIGAAIGERALIERDLAQASTRLRTLMDSRGSTAVCPTCSRPFEAAHGEQFVENQIDEAEQQIVGLQSAISTFDTKLANLTEKLQVTAESGSERRAIIESDLVDVREHLDKAATALAAFARIRANKEGAEKRLVEARARWERYDEEVNPFEAKQREAEARADGLRQLIADDEEQLAIVAKQRERLEFWEYGFSQKGIPVLVLRTVIYELEAQANRFLAALTESRVFCQLAMDNDDLRIAFFKLDDSRKPRERSYLQLSGGERRCVELAFTPFALSEVISNRTNVRMSLLVIDELTTHLGQEEKPIVCDILHRLERETVIVIDHDQTVQGQFDTILDVVDVGGSLTLEEAAL